MNTLSSFENVSIRAEIYIQFSTCVYRTRSQIIDSQKLHTRIYPQQEPQAGREPAVAIMVGLSNSRNSWEEW